ncbi:hypothetical protein BKA83DRAFT_4128571 [Pisolithus microcarpus]|nr:hypothetical protein BKA83DRAFT_4128571 [Pisolithus microcarpus]
MPVPPPDNTSPVPAVSHDVRTVVLAVAHDEQCKNIVWGTIGTRASMICSVDGDTVQGVAARFLVTDPTQVTEASMSSTLMMRLVSQIKHVDDEVRISPSSPPVLTISHAQTIRAADQTCRQQGYNISPLPPTFLLLAVHE